jgi:hypothetical protein
MRVEDTEGWGLAELACFLLVVIVVVLAEAVHAPRCLLVRLSRRAFGVWGLGFGA